MVTATMESGGASPLPAASTPSDVPFEQRVTKICVYCGSSPGSKPEHMEAARQLARVMAANNIQLGESCTVAPKLVQEGCGSPVVPVG